MPYPNLKIVKQIGNEFGVDWRVVSAKTLQKAMRVELEHGIAKGVVPEKTNVTSDDLYLTAQIGLAHLAEFPDYYDRLDRLEKEAEKYWKNRNKPKIFLF